MSCSQLGGPRELAYLGTDHNETIQAHDRHLRDAVAAGSTEHEPALKDMRARWRRPVFGLKWYRRIERDVAALPVEG